MKLLLQIYVEDPAQQYKNEDATKRLLFEDFIKDYFNVSDDFDYDELFAKPMYEGFAHVLDENITKLAKVKWHERVFENWKNLKFNVDYHDEFLFEDFYADGNWSLPKGSGSWCVACTMLDKHLTDEDKTELKTLFEDFINED